MTDENLRQGDVLMFKLGDIDISKFPKAANNIVAYGEVTGHKHQIIGEATVHDIPDSEISHLIEEIQKIAPSFSKEIKPQHLVHVTGPAYILHEEHAKEDLPIGDFIQVIQREYDYIEEEERRVRD